MERLRLAGVKSPADYPRPNLPPSSEWLRSELSVIETAELLAKVFPPSSIEIEPVQDEGDVDIRVADRKTYHLQVKAWTPEQVPGIGDAMPLETLISQARSQVLRDFSAKSPNSSFTKITIHWGKDGGPAYSGLSNTVQNSYGIHVTVVTVDAAILEEMARRKLERSIAKAAEQLKEVGSAILVPVVDLARYPHDQTALIKEGKRLLSHNSQLAGIGGVLLVTQRPGKKDPGSGLHYPETRLIGIGNPKATEERRLDPRVFNPTLGGEVAYEERMVILRVDPPQIDVRVDGRAIIVNGVLFGYLPEGTSVPYALRPYD